MTAIAELRVLLDVIVIADGQDNADHGDDQKHRDQAGLFLGAEPLLDAIEQFRKEFIH